MSVLVGACALSVCQYRYGVWDQQQYLVQVISIEDPAALAGDPYVEAFGSLHSLFWVFVEAVTTEISRPAVCLALITAIATINALLLMNLGRAVIEPRRRRGWTALIAAAPALILAVPKEDNWFGLVSLADIELTATIAVMPLVLASLLAWVRRRFVWSLVFAILAVPVHGQTAAYLLATWWVASAWTFRREARARWALAIVAAAGLAALLFERASVSLPSAMLEQFEALGSGLYSELINPLTTRWMSWAGMLALVAVGAATYVAPVRINDAPTADCSRRLLVWGVASLAFPLLGLALLGLGMREPMLWRLMVGRGFMLVQIVSLIVLAVWCAQRISDGGITAIGAVLALAFMTIWPVWIMTAMAVGAVVIVIILFVVLTARTSAGDAPRPALAAAGVGVSLAALVGLGAWRASPPGFPWLRSGDDPRWLSAQHWARSNTPPGTVFLTPPYLSGWRVESRRPTVGEVKDGGLLFYTGAAAIDWAQRMADVGADELFWLETPGLRAPYIGKFAGLERAQVSYHDAVSRNLDTIRRDYDVAYLLTEAPFDVDTGEVVWSNEAFVIRRLPTAGSAEP